MFFKLRLIHLFKIEWTDRRSTDHAWNIVIDDTNTRRVILSSSELSVGYTSLEPHCESRQSQTWTGGFPKTWRRVWRSTEEVVFDTFSLVYRAGAGLKSSLFLSLLLCLSLSFSLYLHWPTQTVLFPCTTVFVFVFALLAIMINLSFSLHRGLWLCLCIGFVFAYWQTQTFPFPCTNPRAGLAGSDVLRSGRSHTWVHITLDGTFRKMKKKNPIIMRMMMMMMTYSLYALFSQPLSILLRVSLSNVELSTCIYVLIPLPVINYAVSGADLFPNFPRNQKLISEVISFFSDVWSRRLFFRSKISGHYSSWY